MTREQLEGWLVTKGWTKDRWGHYTKGDYRIKLQARSIRWEKAWRTEASQYNKSEKRYTRLYGGYYSQLSVTEEGKLAGMTRG